MSGMVRIWKRCLICLPVRTVAQYEKQYKTLLNQQRITEEQFAIVQKQYSRDSLLHTRGVIADQDLETTKNTFLQSLASRENMHSSLQNMQIQIGQLKESLLDMNEQGTEKLNSLQTQLQSLVSQLKTGIQDWELNYVLRAPIDGKITFTSYWVENQNVTAGGAVFTIIPSGTIPIIGKALLPVARSGKALSFRYARASGYYYRRYFTVGTVFLAHEKDIEGKYIKYDIREEISIFTSL